MDIASILLWLMVVFVAALLLTFVMHIWLGVPYIPTPRKVARLMVELAGLRGDETVMDLGAGDGIVLVEAKRAHPGIRAVGCELVPTIWLLGIVYRAIIRAPRVEVRLKNAFAMDVREADVLLLYLIPEVLQRLLPKFEKELKPGTRIVSHAFKLPGREPIEVRTTWKLGGEIPVYLYHW
jgi:precorrin-6B methylase 2